MTLIENTSEYARAEGLFHAVKSLNDEDTATQILEDFNSYLAHITDGSFPASISSRDFWRLIKSSAPLVIVKSSNKLNPKNVKFYHWCSLFGVDTLEDFASITVENPEYLRENFRFTWSQYHHERQLHREAHQRRSPAIKRTKNITYALQNASPMPSLPAGKLLCADTPRALRMLECSEPLWEQLRARQAVSFRAVALLGERALVLHGALQGFVSVWGVGDGAVRRALEFGHVQRLREEDDDPVRVLTHQGVCEVFGVSSGRWYQARKDAGVDVVVGVLAGAVRGFRELVSEQLAREVLGVSVEE